MINDEARCKAIMVIHIAMDTIDDGYHNREIGDLIRVSNRLFNELPEYLQVQIQQHYDKEMQEGAAV